MVSNISIFEKNNGIKELSLKDLQTIEGGSLPRDSSSFAHDVGYFLALVSGIFVQVPCLKGTTLMEDYK